MQYRAMSTRTLMISFLPAIVALQSCNTGSIEPAKRIQFISREMQLRSAGRNNEISERGFQGHFGMSGDKDCDVDYVWTSVNFMVPGQNVLVIFGRCYSGADQDTVSIAKALRFPAKTESILSISFSIPSQVKMKASG
jgi:hypothetical protein